MSPLGISGRVQHSLMIYMSQVASFPRNRPIGNCCMGLLGIHEQCLGGLI